MFKSTMKAFFKSLRFIIIPMGLIYFGVLTFIILFIEGIVKGVAIFSTAVSTIIKDTGSTVSLSVNEFLDYFKTQSTYTWDGIRSFFDHIVGNFKGLGAGSLESLKASGLQAANQIIIYTIIGLVVFAVMLIASIIITDIVVRRDGGAKSNVGIYFLRLLFKIALLALAIFITYLLNKVNAWLSIPIFILYFLLDLFLSFLFAYFIHRKKSKEKFFKTIRVRDMLFYVLMNMLVMIIAIAIIVLLFLIVRDAFIAVILFIPLVILISAFFNNHVEIVVIDRMKTVNGGELIKPEKKSKKAKKAKEEPAQQKNGA